MKSQRTGRVVLAAFLISTVVPQIRSVDAQGNKQGKNQGKNQENDSENNRVTNRLTVPVSGAVNGVAGTLTGTFAISRFAMQNGTLHALGILIGSVADATGNVQQTIITPAALPVAIPTAPPVPGSAGPVAAPAQATSCSILHLNTQPLDLNLLGLVVHLNALTLDITAGTGPGSLLGNLLCSITGLLDNTPTGQQLVAPLNQMLQALAGA